MLSGPSLSDHSKSLERDQGVFATITISIDGPDLIAFGTKTEQERIRSLATCFTSNAESLYVSVRSGSRPRTQSTNRSNRSAVWQRPQPPSLNSAVHPEVIRQQ
jgi:hypothetical protein